MGQAASQAPHSPQSTASTTARQSCMEMHSAGQASTQSQHPAHFSTSTTAGKTPLLLAAAGSLAKRCPDRSGPATPGMNKVYQKAAGPCYWVSGIMAAVWCRIQRCGLIPKARQDRAPGKNACPVGRGGPNHYVSRYLRFVWGCVCSPSYAVSCMFPSMRMTRPVVNSVSLERSPSYWPDLGWRSLALPPRPHCPPRPAV